MLARFRSSPLQTPPPPPPQRDCREVFLSLFQHSSLLSHRPPCSHSLGGHLLRPAHLHVKEGGVGGGGFKDVREKCEDVREGEREGIIM